MGIHFLIMVRSYRIPKRTYIMLLPCETLLPNPEAYDSFRNQYGRNEEYGSENYRERLAFFAKRRAEVDAQNAQPHKLWWAKLNKLLGKTDLDSERGNFRLFGLIY